MFVLGTRVATHDEALPFSCETFAAGTSAADLAARFGAKNVTRGMVPFGGAEGDENPGTVLFAAQPNARLLIYWRDTPSLRYPMLVAAQTTHSRWQSTAGISIGTTLKEIERLNRRPFEMVGFGMDGGGTIISWSGGRLDEQNSKGCRVRFRLAYAHDASRSAEFDKYAIQVNGGDEFSSRHPALQALNPRVAEMFIQYDR